mmetsp:Transcript_6440/g.11189  ORF Transcript_6440/g.11189 Transcript_6440/m.11189 type:complete len:220 (-) Transcript_6440:948-1607(-)
MPSQVRPTMPSPTTRKMSDAGTYPHSAGSSTASVPFAAVNREEASPVNSWRWRSKSASLRAHVTTSAHIMAASCRTSLSVQGNALSKPRGNIFRITSRHLVAHLEVLGLLSSHLLRFLGSASSASPSAVQTRLVSLSRNSRHIASSGNCIMMACQVPLMQSWFRLASTRVTRFSKHRNSALNRFGVQSYAVLNVVLAKNSKRVGFSNHSASKTCAFAEW